MSGKKAFAAFVEGFHQDMLTWSPKPRYLLKSFWSALSIAGVNNVVLMKKREKEEKKGVLEKEKEADEGDISWEKDGSVCVAYADAIHHFKLESDKINYTKHTSSEATDEKESFDTKILQEEMAILWNLKAKKIDQEKKEKNKEDDVENDIKMLISQWIGFGLKRTAEDLRQLANDKQQLKKALKELRKFDDDLAEKVMREKKQEQNELKRKKKLDKKREKEMQGKKATTSEATAAPEVTAPEATSSEVTAPQATVPGETVE